MEERKRAIDAWGFADGCTSFSQSSSLGSSSSLMLPAQCCRAKMKDTQGKLRVFVVREIFNLCADLICVLIQGTSTKNMSIFIELGVETPASSG